MQEDEDSKKNGRDEKEGLLEGGTAVIRSGYLKIYLLLQLMVSGWFGLVVWNSSGARNHVYIYIHLIYLHICIYICSIYI